MASSYLQKRFSSLDTQMQTEINKTTADYQVRINQLENSRPKYEPSGQNIGGWILGAVILAFFTSSKIMSYIITTSSQGDAWETR